MSQQAPEGPRIVVGVDAFEGATTVLRWAAAQARATHLPLTVVFAWRRPDVSGEPRAAMEFELVRAAEHTASALVADLPPDVTAETVVADGPVVPLLLRHVRPQDLLVLGGHRPASSDDTPLGSVLADCLQRAPCPVVVVPAVTGRTHDDAVDSGPSPLRRQVTPELARATRSREGVGMRAAVGDRLVVHSPHVDGPIRDGEVLEVHGPEGLPPYLVRWSDNGHTSLFFPGPDASVQHLARD